MKLYRKTVIKEIKPMWFVSFITLLWEQDAESKNIYSVKVVDVFG